jgi:beta-mannosidase
MSIYPPLTSDTSLERVGDGYAVTLHSATPARSVYVSFGDLDVRTSDNYFDLLNIAVLAAMPRARVRTATMVKPGDLASTRKPYLTS